MIKPTVRQVILLSLIALLAMSGCSAKRKISGTWTTTSASGVTTYVFNQDGTTSYTQRIVMGASSVEETETGTYTLDGQNMNCALTSASVQSTSLDGSSVPVAGFNIVVGYQWLLKDSKTLDLTVTSVSGIKSASSLVGTKLELTKQP